MEVRSSPAPQSPRCTEATSIGSAVRPMATNAAGDQRREQQQTHHKLIGNPLKYILIIINSDWNIIGVCLNFSSFWRFGYAEKMDEEDLGWRILLRYLFQVEYRINWYRSKL